MINKQEIQDVLAIATQDAFARQQTINKMLVSIITAGFDNLIDQMNREFEREASRNNRAKASEKQTYREVNVPEPKR